MVIATEKDLADKLSSDMIIRPNRLASISPAVRKYLALLYMELKPINVTAAHVTRCIVVVS